MSANAAKEIIFVYNDNENTPELQVDPDGTFPVPIDGTIVRRNGKQWKVTRCCAQSSAGMPSAMPILKINLTDQF